MRSRKKGALDLPIWKVITMALLLVVMVLILFGIQKGFFPSFEKMESNFDEVIAGVKFWGDGEVSYECYDDPVSSYVGGGDFLKSVGYENKDVRLGRCGSVCNMSGGGISPYRINEGVDEKFIDGKWKTWDDLFVGDMNNIKRNWDIYNGALGVLRESDVWVEFMDGIKDTKKFVLYGDGTGIWDIPITATWQNNEWEIVRGDWIKSYDDDSAFDFFYVAVTSGFNDDVYWTVLDADEELDIDEMESIYSITGAGGIYFRGELRWDEEVEKLKKDFFKRKALFLKELDVSTEEVEMLKNDIDGSSFSVGEDNFDLVLVDTSSGFVVSLSSTSVESFGLKYFPHGKTGNKFPVSLISSPFLLVSGEDEWKNIGNEEYYKLPEVSFKEVWDATLVSDFLRAKCR